MLSAQCIAEQLRRQYLHSTTIFEDRTTSWSQRSYSLKSAQYLRSSQKEFPDILTPAKPRCWAAARRSRLSRSASAVTEPVRSRYQSVKSRIVIWPDVSRSAKSGWRLPKSRLASRAFKGSDVIQKPNSLLSRPALKNGTTQSARSV